MNRVTAAAEVKITGLEPFRSFTAAVAVAAGLLAGVDESELPAVARQGVAELRAACDLLGVTAPAPAGSRDSYAGVIVIEWPPANAASPYSSIVGGKVNITDAVTGKPIRTCTQLVVRADVAELVTADLTLFAEENGDPILDGQPVLDGDQVVTGVFPFFVSEMRVQPEIP